MSDKLYPWWYPTKPDAYQPPRLPNVAGISVENSLPQSEIEDYLISEILKLHDPGPDAGLLKNADRPLPYQRAGYIAGTNPRNKPMRGEYREDAPWIHGNRGRPSTKYPDYYMRSYGSHVMFPKKDGE